MKIEPEMPLFKPVAVKITFETKEELDALATVLNINHVCEALFVLGGSQIGTELRNGLQRIGASSSYNWQRAADIIAQK